MREDRSDNGREALAVRKNGRYLGSASASEKKYEFVAKP